MRDAMSHRLATWAVVAAFTLGAVAWAHAQPKPAVPVEPIGAILDAFQTHAVVTLPEWHGDRAMLDFTLNLIRDPRFATVVNDVVVETGNARYQETMDRYIRGERVSVEQLRGVWEDTTVPQAAPSRTSEIPALYVTIRKINDSLPAARKIRVVLGDPPIDWANVRTPSDYRRFLELRDSYPAARIQVEVLAKGRRALVTYGQGHTQRRQVAANYDIDSWQAQTITSILERTTPARLFTIWWETELTKLQEAGAPWPAPGLALVRGTALGAVDFERFSNAAGRAAVRDGKIVPIPRDQWRELPLEEQFDAVLYLGPPRADGPVTQPADVCQDRQYFEERLRRLTVGAPPKEAERYRQLCR
jgi:hypothetical protein